MKAVVHVPICPLMVEPRPDCELADEALCGMIVEVLEQTTDTYWKVRTHYRYEGYAPAACLLPGDEGADAWAALPKKIILHKNQCDVMTRPKVQSWPLITIPRGAVVAPSGETGMAVSPSGETGMAVSPEGEPEDGWQLIALPDGRKGYVRASWLDTYHDKPMDLPEDELRRKVIEMAMLYRGTQYRWGGKTPVGIDCSGLVSMAYLLCGIYIYRDAHIKDDFPVREIPKEAMKPADLLFFPGHVAMYLGDGRYCHSTGKAGDDGFTVNSLDPSAPDFRPDLAEKIEAVGSIF